MISFLLPPRMNAGTSMRLSPVGVGLAIAFFASCAAPVRIVRQNPQKVHRELTANALSAGRMSAATRADLTRRGIGPYFEQHPADALIWLHQVAISPAGDPDDVFALAEGTFLEGARTGD